MSEVKKTGRITERGTQGLPDGYEPKELFPEWQRYRRARSGEDIDQDPRRRYVQSVMVQLAMDNELSVTDLHNQGSDLCDLAGEIILGRGVNPESRLPVNGGVTVPRELSDYRVKIKSIKEGKDGKIADIKWKTRLISKGSIGVATSPAIVPWDGSPGVSKKSRVEEEVYNEQATEKVYPLDEAWLVLHQQGWHCRMALTDSTRKLLWKVKEVMPRKRRAPKKPDAQSIEVQA